ncbi:hypothetical protein RQP46_003866 [Phenoliferia psychrophenolica]
MTSPAAPLRMSDLNSSLAGAEDEHREKRIKHSHEGALGQTLGPRAGGAESDLEQGPGQHGELDPLLLRIHEELGPASRSLTDHLLADPAFRLRPFVDQIDHLCRALRSAWTRPLLEILKPSPVTTLYFGPFRTCQDIGSLLSTFADTSAAFCGLTSLTISSSRVAASALLSLLSLPLTHLRLSHTCTDIASVAYILSLAPTLTSLSLDGNPAVGDTALPVLSLFGALIFLDLSGTSVTVPALLSFIRRTADRQPHFKHLTPPRPVLEWLESLSPAVLDLDPLKYISLPSEVDKQIKTKAVVLLNLSLHLPPNKVPPTSWNLPILREKLKTVLQSRLDQMTLMDVLSPDSSAIRRYRSVPSPTRHLPPSPSSSAWTVAVFPALSEAKSFTCTWPDCGKGYE